jgi:hypothetical protein
VTNPYMWADPYRICSDLSSDHDEDIARYQRLAAETDGPVAGLGIGICRAAAVVKPDNGVDISRKTLSSTPLEPGSPLAVFRLRRPDGRRGQTS